jgi:uncharacterized membrane protein YjjP (DUF1212 family)
MNPNFIFAVNGAILRRFLLVSVNKTQIQQENQVCFGSLVISSIFTVIPFMFF